MKTVYLVRHGQARMNVDAHIVGGRSVNSPLTLIGKTQGKLLKKRFGVGCIVYSSPALRCIDTATYLGSDHVVDTALIELSLGEWEGRLCKDVLSAYDKAFADPHGKAPGGESRAEVADRMITWLKGVQDENGDIVVVSHGMAIRCLLWKLVGFPYEWLTRFWIHNAGVYQLQFDKDWSVVGLNDLSHLSGKELITY